ncbi:hypothetical protein L6164_007921 [Bauhinia variegata]|uniref:Uncharacterized protein n=1 Tax=Bauhinia variegata TaxID=167791 RepID=A0ACB9PG89_BAUVA|nr:hypothetical protein L6164_007921 [Bauhinia variegata]
MDMKKKKGQQENRRRENQKTTEKRMESPYFGRHQRPKGKQALLVLLLLAVSVWLVYQIKHSINKRAQNYGSETQLVEEFAAVSLGRKVTPSHLEETVLTHSRNALVEAKNTDSDREYVFDGTMKDRIEAEFEGKQVENELEMQSKSKSENSPKGNNGEGLVKSRKRSESDDKAQGNYDKDPKTPTANDSQNYDKEPEMQIREPANVVQRIREETKSDGSIKENGENEETKTSEEEAKMLQNEDRVHSFQDENGVSSDDNEIELMGGQTLVKEIV